MELEGKDVDTIDKHDDKKAQPEATENRGVQMLCLTQGPKVEVEMASMAQDATLDTQQNPMLGLAADVEVEEDTTLTDMADVVVDVVRSHKFGYVISTRLTLTNRRSMTCARLSRCWKGLKAVKKRPLMTAE